MRASPALALVLAMCSMWVDEAGAATLYPDGTGAMPREASFEYDVRIEGLVAVITARQTLVTTEDVDAVYSFALPGDAAVVGLAVTPAGGKAQRGVPVDAVAAITPAVDAGTVAIAPDLGLVRRLGSVDERDVVYELRVSLDDAGPTMAEVTWVQPLAVDDGRLVLRVPGRGADDNLASATGTVKVTPPTGVKSMRELHADGDLLAAAPGKKAWKFTAPRSDLRIDVRPVLGKAPLVVWSHVPVGDAGGAIAVAALRPREAAPASAFGRVVIVVDVSPSTAAAADELGGLVEAIAEGLPAARFEVVSYDREAHRLTTAFQRTTVEDAVRIAGDAVRAVEMRAGSNLIAGLDVAGDLLRGDGAASGERGDLVVVITDGVLPSDAATSAFETALATEATVSAVLLAGDDSVLPVTDGPIHGLAGNTGGHVVTLRRSEMLVRAKALAGELAAPPTWAVTGVDAGAADVRVELPEALHAGGGAIGFGWYAGAAPKKLKVETSAGVLVAKATKLRHLAALAVHVTPYYAPGIHGAGDEAAARAIAQLERRAAVVGEVTTLVAVDGRDELAAARGAHAAKGGTFSRIPRSSNERIPEPTTVEIEVAANPGSRYEIDTAGRIRADLLSTQLLPAARRCQQVQLRKGGAKQGSVALEIEIARGEVITVRASSTAGASTMTSCLTEAAYALAVPSYTLDDPEAIYLIRYPLHFAPSDKAKDADDAVTVGDDHEGPAKIEVPANVDDPLGDLKERER